MTAKRKDLSEADFDRIASEFLLEIADEHTDDFELVVSWIRRAARDPSALRDLIKFKRMPVGPREFIESPQYMDKPAAMWPAVMAEFVELNSGRYVESVLTGGIGVGKRLCVDTPIPSPRGFIRMGDLRDGDLIYGADGQICKVVKAHPVEDAPESYAVWFSDGTVIFADAEHLWETQTRSERVSTARTGKRKSAVRTTRHIAETQCIDGKHVNHSIPVASPVTGRGVQFCTDPYLLGVWLGDGDSTTSRISTDDPEILEAYRSQGYTVRHIANYDYQVKGGFQDVLRYWSLIDNKHVPADWVQGTVAQRLAVVQGLMDTDGTVGRGNGSCQFVQKRECIVDGLMDLLWSLGYQPRKAQIYKRYQGKLLPYYQVTFAGRPELPPFRLQRKLRLIKSRAKQASRHDNRFIVSVTPVDPRPMRCITVDSPDSLYLCGRAHVPTHNTHIALYTQAYQLYLLSCLRDPHSEFDLDPASEILIVFQSKTKELAKGVDYDRFRAMLEDAPYFKRHFAFSKDLLSEMRFPNRIIVKPISGEDTGAIGQNVIGGIIDEINFMAVTEKSKMSKDGGTYDQAVKNYNSIARRRESRFMQLGTLPGMLCLVSSRNYPGQFTDKKEEEARTNPRIFVYDKRVWELRPERFSGQTFPVFIGDMTRKPAVLEDTSRVALKDEALIMQIPVEYLDQFKNDLLAALRDIAGVATMALHPFMIDTDAITRSFGVVPSIASREDCDFIDSKVSLYPQRIVNPEEPRLCHIDLAYAKDSAGVSIGHVTEFRKIARGDHVEMLPVIRFDMVLEIKVPKGGEIEFENIRKLIYTIRDKLGIPLKWISFDGFQSVDSMQMLYQRGFVVHYQSMDKDTEAYDFTKQAFYDGRVEAPAHAKAQREMITLEIDTKKRIIDHPPHGSKDVSDSMAGVIRGLTILREIWVRHGIPMQMVPPNIARKADQKSATKIKKGGGVDFEDMVDDEV